MDLVDIVNATGEDDLVLLSSHATRSRLGRFSQPAFPLSMGHRRCPLLGIVKQSYTRIYLGVHFVSDIVAGMLVGTLIAFLLFLALSLCAQQTASSFLAPQSVGLWPQTCDPALAFLFLFILLC